MAPSGLGFFGSPYNPADAMKTPGDLGIKVGSSMGDVVNGIKGVGFYIDQIGFGAPSTGLTNGMPLKPLGINYFMNTGTQCSNGADMWEYVQGIPEGDALGKTMKKAMSDMGLPPLKGLAPGMIEDMKNALDPAPLMNSLLGSGYPKCKKSGPLPVGDSYGRIQDPSTGEPWISDPSTAYRQGDIYVQEKWVIDTDAKGNPIYLSRDEWVAEQKVYNKDGTPKKKEGFEVLSHPVTILSIGLLCFIAFGVLSRGGRSLRI
jgi:hypothetical protein